MKIISSHIPFDPKDVFAVEQHIYNYIDGNCQLVPEVHNNTFPDNFTEEKLHLIMPTFFSRILGLKNGSALVRDISVAGFFYFKYLLCFDVFADQDNVTSNKNTSQKILLQAHTYHQESLKILGRVFGNKKKFWDMWNIRTNELLSSLMQDKAYNIKMAIGDYETLCVRKCAFYKVAIDALFSTLAIERRNKKIEIYEDLLAIIENFSIGRCIQDDIEDVVKDFRFQKNNLCHIELNKALIELGKTFSICNEGNIQNMCIGTGVYEKTIKQAICYYQKALSLSEKYPIELKKLAILLKSMENTLSLYLAQFKAYRVDKMLKKNKPVSQAFVNRDMADGAFAAKRYIARMQFPEGCWYEILNKQGLSNVWSTAFISMFNNDDGMVKAAGQFLLDKRHMKLWGYNDDWTYDYDSSTCSLIALNKAGLLKEAGESLGLWIKGQNPDGGFSTYTLNNPDFTSRMSLPPNKLKGWCRSQVCVSALAYFFLTTSHGDVSALTGVRNFLLSKRLKSGLWSSYWWTSRIYSTYFVLQGMLNDSDIPRNDVYMSIRNLVKIQNADGSFNCDFSRVGSAFYTALVVDLLCSDSKFAGKYRMQIDLAVNWLLSKQLQDGSFFNSNFLAIPNPNAKKWDFRKKASAVNIFGGGSSITGEQYSCYSTIVAYSAFSKFLKIANR